VATYSVIGVAPSSGAESKPRLKPKSHILSSQSELTSRFPGLRSRWITEAECTYFMPTPINKMSGEKRVTEAVRYTSQDLVRKILDMLISKGLP
jgi:hypothetical protein